MPEDKINKRKEYIRQLAAVKEQFSRKTEDCVGRGFSECLECQVCIFSRDCRILSFTDSIPEGEKN